MRIFFNVFFVFLFGYCIDIYSQNLINNPSFSEVYPKNDLSVPYKITPKGSDSKSWYIPNYLGKLDKDYYTKLGVYYFTEYLSSLDKEIVKSRKLEYYGEQLFENNLGYIRFFFSNLDGPSLIQQKLTKKILKGRYCLKFKYKYVAINSNRNGQKRLEIVLSESNLSEYYRGGRFYVPDSLVNSYLRIENEEIDDNIPWQQKCSIVELSGKENYISIGSLTNTYKNPIDRAVYLIDDIELYYLEDASICTCEIIQKNFRGVYTRDFRLNTPFYNDTLVMFTPLERSTSLIIAPDTKIILNQIISFMQRNPDIKVKLLEHDSFTKHTGKPSYTYNFMNYLRFYNIAEDRITEKYDLCRDEKCQYCKKFNEYVRLGFYFYKE